MNCESAIYACDSQCHNRLLFFNFALFCAWQTLVILSSELTNPKGANGKSVPTTPHCLYFGEETQVSKCWVRGCPAVIRAHTLKYAEGQVVDHSNTVQRAVPGIFVGFPVNQSGWQFFAPSTRGLILSIDASFDEDFTSVLALTNFILTGSSPMKPLPQMFGAKTGFACTGPPLCLADHHNNQDESVHWTPYTIIESEHETDIICKDEVPSMDVCVASSDEMLKEANEWKCPSLP